MRVVVKMTRGAGKDNVLCGGGAGGGGCYI